MSRFINLNTIIFGLSLLFSSPRATVQNTPVFTPDPVNQLGFDVFRQIVNTTNPEDNILISPLSISLALSMTYNGAHGDTKTQMADVLGYSGMADQQVNANLATLSKYITSLDPSTTMHLANSIWLQHGMALNNDFESIVQKDFQSEINRINVTTPGAADQINGWIEGKTNGKITDVISAPIDPNIVMLLINAIYFKGIWKTPFDPRGTIDFPFYITPEQRFQCDMMTMEHTLPYFDNKLFQAVSLPYGNSSFAMTILLPRADHSPDDIIKTLDKTNWDQWRHSAGEQKIKLFLPKFKMEFEDSLNSALQYLGMSDAFSSSAADFSNMVPGGGIWIDKVLHKSFLQVDEAGSEAAAATAVIMKKSAPSTEFPTIMINRPFVMIISDRDTGTILFIGKIAKPTPINQ